LEHPQEDLEKEYIEHLATKLAPGVTKMIVGKQKRMSGHKRPWNE
jgi:hypothetical protein